jgi:hypothetical protein
MREGEKVVMVQDRWYSAFGDEWVLERGMRLTCNKRKRFGNVWLVGFDELDVDPQGDPPLFDESGFRPLVLN